MYILLPCSFPSTYYDWQKLECYIFQNEFANVNFSSIRRQFAIVQFTDSFVCSFSVLDLMYFFSIIIMFQWFKNHFTLKLSLVKVGSFFFHYHFAWDDWWYHVFLRACCFERKWWYFVCKLFFFFMLNKKKRNDLFMSVLLDDVRSFFFSNIVNTMMSRSKLEQSKCFFSAVTLCLLPDLIPTVIRKFCD